MLACRWYALLLPRTLNTQLVLCEAWDGTLAVTGRLLIAMAGRLVVEVGWQRCCLKDCWECCSSLRLARWSVLFSEAQWSQRVDLLKLNLLYDWQYVLVWSTLIWGIPRISLLMSWGGPNIETACNNSCVIATVGYHGNSVYQVVASILVWVTVTSVAIW
jgi:hypothetical protein